MGRQRAGHRNEIDPVQSLTSAMEATSHLPEKDADARIISTRMPPLAGLPSPSTSRPLIVANGRSVTVISASFRGPSGGIVKMALILPVVTLDQDGARLARLEADDPCHALTIKVRIAVVGSLRVAAPDCRMRHRLSRLVDQAQAEVIRPDRRPGRKQTSFAPSGTLISLRPW